jgi:hypothetical protein
MTNVSHLTKPSASHHPSFPGFFASFRRKSTAAVTVASAETKQASASVLSSFKSKDWKGDAGRIKVRMCGVRSDDNIVSTFQDKILLQTIGGEAALLPETREDVISTGIVPNFHALSDFLAQLHAALKAIGDAEAKAALEHERLAALCAPFNLELPFSASIATLGKLHAARAVECRGVYGQFKNLSIEEKARRISADVCSQAGDDRGSDSLSGDETSPAAGEAPFSSTSMNVPPTPYGKLEAALSALISGPLFSIGRYAAHESLVRGIHASGCRYRLIYRDAHRDATIQHVRVKKLKEGDKQFEAEVSFGGEGKGSFGELSCSKRK